MIKKLLQILKNQESTKTEIQDTIHEEAKGINDKIDDTDYKIQQVQDNTEQIQDKTQMIGRDVKNMREDIQDQHYNINQRLGHIEYQNHRLYELAASTVRRQQSTPIRYPQQHEIEYVSPQSFTTQPAITYSISPPYVQRRSKSEHRRSVTRQSVAVNQEHIVYDDSYTSPQTSSYATPQKNSSATTKGRWLDKFGM